jgi:predicted deacylase
MPDHPPIEFDFPDVRRWEHGVAPYIHVFDSGKPGPTVMVAALTHGNEVSGAVVVDELLARELRPRKGKLIFSFNNIEAYLSFNAQAPFKSRMINEDFNRVWGRLDQPATTLEMKRALVVRPFVQRADLLLDLHSMHDDSVPLMLCGPLERGVEWARRIGTPADIVRDRGHAAGKRMRDYGAFGDPKASRTALLIECGQHWAASSAEVAYAACIRMLERLNMAPDAFKAPDVSLPREATRFVEITMPVTIKHEFVFALPLRGGEVIPRAGTLIGYDGGEPVVTPHDDCFILMPSQRLWAGLTAVRLGRLITAPARAA